MVENTGRPIMASELKRNGKLAERSLGKFLQNRDFILKKQRVRLEGKVRA